MTGKSDWPEQPVAHAGSTTLTKEMSDELYRMFGVRYRSIQNGDPTLNRKQRRALRRSR